MANPDFREFDTALGNKAKGFKRSTPAGKASVNEKTANWPGLAGKAQPRDRSAGVKRVRIHPKSVGI